MEGFYCLLSPPLWWFWFCTLTRPPYVYCPPQISILFLDLCLPFSPRICLQMEQCFIGWISSVTSIPRAGWNSPKSWTLIPLTLYSHYNFCACKAGLVCKHLSLNLIFYHRWILSPAGFHGFHGFPWLPWKNLLLPWLWWPGMRAKSDLLPLCDIHEGLPSPLKRCLCEGEVWQGCSMDAPWFWLLSKLVTSWCVHGHLLPCLVLHPG